MDTAIDNVFSEENVPHSILFKNYPKNSTSYYFYDLDYPKYLFFGPINTKRQVDILNIRRDLLIDISVPKTIEICDTLFKYCPIFGKEKNIAIYRNLEFQFPKSWEKVEKKQHLEGDFSYVTADDIVSKNFDKKSTSNRNW